MNWNEKLQLIIDYVEHHLQRKEEPVCTQDIEKMAGCSYAFFQKVFTYMNGISFADYIRLRKLTLAGYDLKSTDIKVLELSYKYGYDSPTSFTKAFRQFHGVSPKEARETGVRLRVYPKMQLTAKSRYSFRIEHMPALCFAGICTKIYCGDGEQNIRIPGFWNTCKIDGTYSRLLSMDTRTPRGLFGMFGSFDKAENRLEYTIMANTEQDIPEDFCKIILPEGAWAVFDCKGPVPKAVQDGWKYLNEEWLVQYPFQHRKCQELEWYSEGNPYSGDYASQIWIPIIA